MLGMEQALLRGYCGQEPQLLRDAELSWTGAARAPVRVAEVAAGAHKLTLDAGDAVGDLGAHVGLGQLAEGKVRLGMRADRHQRILRKLAQLVPGHEELGVARARVDAIRFGKHGDDGARQILGDRAQPPIDLMIGGFLLGSGTKREMPSLALHAERDVRGRAQHVLERQPPQVGPAVGEIARHVDREREPVALEDRIGVLAVVAVPVIEREAGEGALAAVSEAVRNLIEGNHVEARIERGVNHRIEEVGRHAQDAARREVLRRIRAHLDAA